MATIKFLVYGGLYLRTDMRRSNRPLNRDIDLSLVLCIKLSYDCAFNTDIKLENYQGPYAFLALYDLLYAELYIGDSVSDFRISITKRELFLIPEKAINVSQAITAELLNNKASY